MMSQVVACPHCQGQVVNDPRLGSQLVSCPHCQGRFTMPAMVSVATDTPAQPSDIGLFIVKQSSSTSTARSRYRHQRGVPPESSTMKMWLGIVGSVVLFVGVFTPIISFPIVGNVNLFQNGNGVGVVVLALAGISLVLTLMKIYVGLWLTGLSSLAIMGMTFVNFHLVMAKAKSEMETELQGNPFRGLTDAAMLATQLQWGWALLVVGAGLVIASAAVPSEPSRRSSRLRG